MQLQNIMYVNVNCVKHAYCDYVYKLVKYYIISTILCVLLIDLDKKTDE